MKPWRLDCGDCRQLLAQLPDNSIDAIVTDPPYELGFMGRDWDRSGIAYDPDVWAHCLRVLKPGGHLAAFGATRTYHRMACAIEDVGFEIRDSLHWIYGSGFPKSLDVSKAIDRAAGADRQVIGRSKGAGSTNTQSLGAYQPQYDATAPATDAARQWQGFGTALKPAHEPIVLARKPLSGTVAANVQLHSTGALNVDACRLATDDDCAQRRALVDPASPAAMGAGAQMGGDGHEGGRWPPNVLLGAVRADWSAFFPVFRYEAKASRAEREAGLDALPVVTREDITGRKADSAGQNHARSGKTATNIRNVHTTVKPIALMRWLVRLITPPGGRVLDPFTGSGTTGAAALMEGFAFVGFELDPKHVEIAAARIAHWHGVAGISADQARQLDDEDADRTGHQISLFSQGDT